MNVIERILDWIINDEKELRSRYQTEVVDCHPFDDTEPPITFEEFKEMQKEEEEKEVIEEEEKSNWNYVNTETKEEEIEEEEIKKKFNWRFWKKKEGEEIEEEEIEEEEEELDIEEKIKLSDMRLIEEKRQIESLKLIKDWMIKCIASLVFIAIPLDYGVRGYLGYEVYVSIFILFIGLQIYFLTPIIKHLKNKEVKKEKRLTDLSQTFIYKKNS